MAVGVVSLLGNGLDTNDLSGACTAKDEVLSGTTENVKSGANKERAPTLPLISDIG